MAAIRLSIPNGPSSFYGLGARLPGPMTLQELAARIASLRAQTNTSPSAAAGQTGMAGLSGMLGAGLRGPAPAVPTGFPRLPSDLPPASMGTSPSAGYGVANAPDVGYGPPPRRPGPPPRGPATKQPGPSGQPPPFTPPTYATDQQLQQQASDYVTNALAPLIKAATDAENARAAAGESAIKGYSGVLADALAKYAGVAKDIYSGAEGQQQAGDQALASELKGVGSQVASGLPEALAAAALGRGAGSAGASSALGNSNLSQLVGDSAAAQDYAAKQPGIAQQGALQSSKQLEAQTSADLANQLGQINGQAPGMIGQIYQNLVGNRTQQQQFDTGQAAAATGRAQTNATNAYNAGMISQRQLGQALGLSNWQSLPDTPKQAAAKTLTIRPGDTVVDATTGKILASVPPTSSSTQPRPIILSPGQVAYLPNGKMIQGPVKPGAAPKPPAAFTLSPGQTRVIPDGKGGFTKISAPAAPTDAKAPAHFTAGNGQQYTWNAGTGKWEPVAGTQKPTAQPRPIVVGSPSTGWNVVDPATGKTIATMNGATARPVVTGSPQTGWTARDPQTRKVLWTQAGAPPKPPAQPSAADTKQKLALIATTGGVNWQTGQTTPSFRKAVADAGVSNVTPAPLTPEERVKLATYLGINTSAGAAGKTTTKATSTTARYLVRFDASGNVIGKVKNPNYVPPSAKAQASSKQQPSYTDLTKAKADAADSAKDAYYGVPDNIVKVVKNGQVVAENQPIPKRSYTDALKDLTSHGIPEDVATKALNRYYKPGERGRPATTADYLRDKAIIWQRDGQGNVVAYRVFKNKNGTERRQALGRISPQDPNYRAALARARNIAA